MRWLRISPVVQRPTKLIQPHISANAKVSCLGREPVWIVRTSVIFRSAVVTAAFIVSLTLSEGPASAAADGDQLYRIEAEPAFEAFRRGEYDTAEKLFSEVISDFPDKPGPWRYRAMAKAKQGLGVSGQFEPKFLDSALQDLEMAEKNASNAKIPSIVVLNEVRTDRGLILEQLGRFRDAIKEYNALLAVDPDEPNSLSRRGHCFSKLKQYDDALVDLKKASRIAGPHDHHDQVSLANLLFEMGARKDAHDVLQKLTNSSPKDVEAVAALAVIEWSQGNNDTAERLWAKALSLDGKIANIQRLELKYEWMPEMLSALQDLKDTAFLDESGPTTGSGAQGGQCMALACFDDTLFTAS
eukprot:CAMPEP_0184666366 /NCGR_PEP_ID=MMETSP0308-20130426/61095_1 /TAXON_ID=38269 /ORGANISM="Gloeochaete witrockiana, Strain SAG 46.84" /LENGTH=355 /DNA_ID=CAMNT_0027110887 /DNA_START=144 /DNA_END=1212 /DNA_ORIENTATION=-